MVDMNISDYKYCYACDTTQLRSNFHCDASRADGLDARCRGCKSEWHFANRDRNLQRMRDRRRQTA